MPPPRDESCARKDKGAAAHPARMPPTDRGDEEEDDDDAAAPHTRDAEASPNASVPPEMATGWLLACPASAAP